jgi:hypothetical protein
MSRRRLAVLAGMATLSAGIAPLATGAHADGAPAPVMPKVGCFDATDPSGDASFDGVGPQDDSLDITGLALESTKTDLLGFIKAPKLATSPSTGTDGERFTMSFTFNGHVFGLSGSSYSHGTGAIRDGLATTGQAGKSTQLSIDAPASATSQDGITGRVTGGLGYKDSGLKFTFDTKNGWVIVDLPIADIEKYGGAKFTGPLSAVGAYAAYDNYAVSSGVDSTSPDNLTNDFTLGWKVGTNKCFPAPPAPKKKKKH